MELFVIFLVLGATFAQEPSPLENAPSAAVPRTLQKEAEGRRVQYNGVDDKLAAIVRNDQHLPDAEGVHSFDFESENGIKFEFSGSEGENGGSNMHGVYRYPLEDGSVAEVTFVADENGYQPDSTLLPVAPAFPHPIPQYVLDQIAFAAEEDARRAREGPKE